jgi:hypothetical protein
MGQGSRRGRSAGVRPCRAKPQSLVLGVERGRFWAPHLGKCLPAIQELSEIL